LAEDVIAGDAMPEAARAAMDGFAVRAVDVANACAAAPASLNVLGEVFAGAMYPTEVHSGEAVRIPTGGCLPAGTDAVVPIENTAVRGLKVDVVLPSQVGAHVVAAGEDVRAGQTLLLRGQRLKARHLAVLAAVGHADVSVAMQPRVTVLSSGAEVCPPEHKPTPAQVRDVNQTLLGALCESQGALVQYGGIIADELALLTQALLLAAAHSDVVLLSAGTSVGVRDFAASAVTALPGARLLFHGVNMRPGKPTLVAHRQGCPEAFICGLPGFPMSAAVAFKVFVAPLLKQLQGGVEPSAGLWAVMAEPYRSSLGREDYVRVRLEPQADGAPLARPLSMGPALVTGLLYTEGFVRVPPETETLRAGTQVRVLTEDL
jgi:molybdopterin molybdotransferase